MAEVNISQDIKTSLTGLAAASITNITRKIAIAVNLISNSVWVGTVPLTGWSHPATDDGATPAGASSLDSGSIAYRFLASAGREFFRQNLSLSVSTTYTLSFFVEAFVQTTNSEVVYLSGLVGVTGDHVTSGAVRIRLADLTVGQRFETTFTTAADGVGLLDVGAGAASSATEDVTLSAFQLETGSSALEYEPTT